MMHDDRKIQIGTRRQQCCRDVIVMVPHDA